MAARHRGRFKFQIQNFKQLSRPAARKRPSCCIIAVPQKTEGAGDPQKKRAQGRPGARCTRDLMCKTQIAKNAHEHTGSAEAVRPSLRNGSTVYSVLSPARPGLFVTVIPKKRELPRNLTPAIGASGPHDFAVRFSHARQSRLWRPSLPDPRFVTVDTPLLRARDNAIKAGDLRRDKTGIFLPRILDRQPKSASSVG